MALSGRDYQRDENWRSSVYYDPKIFRNTRPTHQHARSDSGPPTRTRYKKWRLFKWIFLALVVSFFLTFLYTKNNADVQKESSDPIRHPPAEDVQWHPGMGHTGSGAVRLHLDPKK